MDLVSKKSDKVFDDTLVDLGGIAMFDVASTKLDKEFRWLNQATADDWKRLAPIYLGHTSGTIYVRFVHPCHERFGSIAKLTRSSYYSNSYYNGYGYNRSYQKPDQSQEVAEFARQRSLGGDLRWNGRNSSPNLYSYSDYVEWLPNYNGETHWAFDRERKQRVHAKAAFDRLGREIQVGDFCTYILYQFDGRGAAGIYFGNVTAIDKEGKVTCKNITLKSGERVAEKEIKDNNLITILTDDLMRQLMLSKLASA